jgi:hypothetical protein
MLVEKVEDPPSAGALKRDGADPVLGADAARGGAKAPGPVPAAYVPVRERLAHAPAEALFVSADDLAVVRAEPDAHALPALFPELAPYGLRDPAPAPVPARRKKGAKDDKDDAARRADDAYYARLVPLSAFMLAKPTLVSALRPAVHWDAARGWHDLDNVPVSAESELPPAPKGPDESLCSASARDPRSILHADACLYSALRAPHHEARDDDGPGGPQAVCGRTRRARAGARALRRQLLVAGRGPTPEGALRPLSEQLAPHLRLVQRDARARAARQAQPLGLRRALAPQVGPVSREREGTRGRAGCARRAQPCCGRRGHNVDAHAPPHERRCRQRTRVWVAPVRRASRHGGHARRRRAEAEASQLGVRRREEGDAQARARPQAGRCVVCPCATRTHADIQLAAATAQRKGNNVHDTHAQYTKMVYKSPVDLAKQKMEKDAQVQAELLARRAAEQAQRQHRQAQLLGSVRTLPVGRVCARG